MPTIHVGSGWKITMYAADHNPPHFHIITADGEAQVQIDNLEIMRGRISARNWRLARNWAATNQTALIETWQRLQALT
jgi:hypothetical protein